MIAAWLGVHRSTISHSITEIRPLLAERGCGIHAGIRSGPSPTWWPTSDTTRRRRWTPPKCGYAVRSRAERAGTGSVASSKGCRSPTST
ncbi:hypothetical protein ACQP1S_11675 [Micromonospora matsumotoense]|uniref:hypothetical protein n=1 Tax=Micromonospora matsumotoense TaxID=121616 RepID=UPI003D8E9029